MPLPVAWPCMGLDGVVLGRRCCRILPVTTLPALLGLFHLRHLRPPAIRLRAQLLVRLLVALAAVTPTLGSCRRLPLLLNSRCTLHLKKQGAKLQCSPKSYLSGRAPRCMSLGNAGCQDALR